MERIPCPWGMKSRNKFGVGEGVLGMITSSGEKAMVALSLLPLGCQTSHPSRGRGVPGFWAESGWAGNTRTSPGSCSQLGRCE